PPWFAENGLFGSKLDPKNLIALHPTSKEPEQLQNFGEFCKRLECQKFFPLGHAQKTKIPPNPPLSKGGTTRNCFKKSPFGKGGFRGI
ncbi:MAG: hypothetical protein M0P73_00930, partial [Syntrophobacterales bacterium]|nr:hypothetical protein [Syntrophobacterales bacterium]